MHQDLIPLLVARGSRFNRCQRVDLFWTGSSAGTFHVYRDGRRITTVSATSYTDRLECDGSGSYRYMVLETETATRSNEAGATFSDPGRQRLSAASSTTRAAGAAVSPPAP